MKFKSVFLSGLCAALLQSGIQATAGVQVQKQSAHYARYKMVDVGTFGGPDSLYNAFTKMATNSGIIVGAADTADPDPFAPDCFDFKCFQLHGWKWHKGRLKDLGVLPGGLNSYTNAVNDQGAVVGQSQNGTGDSFNGNRVFLATLWDHRRIKNLGTLGGEYSFAIAITNRNFVMGATESEALDTSGFAQVIDIGTKALEWHAFGWTGGKIFDLGSLGGPGAFPNYMNDRGQIVGFSPTTSIPGPFGIAPFSPFLWRNGKMRNLGTLGGTFAVANAVNNRGQVAGDSNLEGDEVNHAYFWGHGRMEDLGTLGGDFATAEALNDRGEVIGFSLINNNQGLIHAYLWKRGRILDIGTVAGDNSSNAFGINDRGQVVGQSWFFDGQDTTASHPFLWQSGSPIVDLNTLIVNPTDLFLTEANNISDRGWIVANGLLPNGEIHTAILIPECDWKSEGMAEERDASVTAFVARAPGFTPQMRTALNAHMKARSLQEQKHRLPRAVH